MARAKAIDRPAPADGKLLLGLVGLGTVFMLVMGLLGTMKTGSLFNEANLLFTALTFYAAATVLYVGFGVTGTQRFIRSAWIATWAGFISNTLAAAHRWYIAGHAPFSSIYEMLLAFVWAIAGLTIFIQWRWKVKVIGTITMPLAMIGVLLMQLLPSEIRPLVPALQPTWLHIHVTLAMLSYAACAVSFGLAMMFLIQDNMRTESFLANVSALTVVIYGGILMRFAAGGGLKVVAQNPETGGELFISRGVPMMVVIPDLGYLLAVVLAVVLSPLALYAWGIWKNDENAYVMANRAFFVSMLFQLVATLSFVLRMRGAQYPAAQGDGVFPTSLSTSPFILAGLVSGLMAGMLYLMLTWRREGLQQMLPTAERLDNLTYKTIGVAFPLLTAMIAAGAYWANRTWGSYWSWDPKETAALITWLVYAGYLHMRIARGWRGRRAAYFAVLGFAVVMFTFFGVTYLLPGLHAYA